MNPAPRITFSHLPGPPEEGSIPSNLPAEDLLRRHLPATSVIYQNGVMLVDKKGILLLCDQVISGKTPGNIPAAEAMKSKVLATFGPD